MVREVKAQAALRLILPNTQTRAGQGQHVQCECRALHLLQGAFGRYNLATTGSSKGGGKVVPSGYVHRNEVLSTTVSTKVATKVTCLLSPPPPLPPKGSLQYPHTHLQDEVLGQQVLRHLSIHHKAHGRGDLHTTAAGAAGHKSRTISDKPIASALYCYVSDTSELCCCGRWWVVCVSNTDTGFMM